MIGSFKTVTRVGCSDGYLGGTLTYNDAEADTGRFMLRDVGGQWMNMSGSAWKALCASPVNVASELLQGCPWKLPARAATMNVV